jgi:plasmid stabilization system protein ParE
MVNKYIVYEDAVIDFEQIVHYITYKLKYPEGPIRLIELFEKKLNSIVSFPYAYPVIDDAKLEINGLRKCSLDNYLIIYNINEELEQAEVVRIMYQREDFL